MLNKFTQYSARFNQFYTGFFLIVDADDFFLAFETNCTEFRHALFPRERDLYTHESNGNVRSYENQAYLVRNGTVTTGRRATKPTNQKDLRRVQ